MAWHKLLWLVILLVPFITETALSKTPVESLNQRPRRSILVVIGASGEEEYGKAFLEWSKRWRTVFQSDDFSLIDGTSDVKPGEKEHRLQILDWIGKDSGDSPDGMLQERWLVLIGHGTHDRTAAKFNLKGPDISADAISKALAKVKAKWLIIDGSSSSGPFINALSGENRIVITATKSGAEQNYTRFGEYLSQAISDRSTDLDHDDCVSILEAFLAASNRVAKFYENEGRLASEQALLDDNGDGRGTPAAFYRGARPVKAPANGLKLDGPIASRTLVSSFGEPDLRTNEQRAQSDMIADQIELLRARKKELPEDEYYQELERLFLEIAKANLSIGL